MAKSKQHSAVGLDTSVVLRLLMGEPRAQADRAMRFLNELVSQGKQAIVSDLVVAETYFALHAHYEVPKKEAVRTLLEFLQSGLAHPEPEGCSVNALRTSAGSSQRLGFVDRLIHAQYMKSAGGLASFEKSVGRLENATVLGAPTPS